MMMTVLLTLFAAVVELVSELQIDDPTVGDPNPSCPWARPQNL